MYFEIKVLGYKWQFDARLAWVQRRDPVTKILHRRLRWRRGIKRMKWGVATDYIVMAGPWRLNLLRRGFDLRRTPKDFTDGRTATNT